MFARRNRNERSSSNASNLLSNRPPPPPSHPPPEPPQLPEAPRPDPRPDPRPAPLISPLQMTFDFELDPPNSSSLADSVFRTSQGSPVGVPRPKTSDGSLGGSSNRKSFFFGSPDGLQPPILPPIPRVASSSNSFASSGSDESRPATAAAAVQRPKLESDTLSIRSGISVNRKSRLDSDTLSVSGLSLSSRRSIVRPRSGLDQHPVDLMPSPNPPTARSSTSGASTPRMEASLFPPRSDSVAYSQPSNVLPTSRAFVDSRDKPYSHAPSRPPPSPLQTSHSMPLMASMPDLTDTHPPASLTGFYTQSPVSQHLDVPPSPASLRAPRISGARLSPNSSVEDLRLPQRSPTSSTFGPQALQRSTTAGMAVAGLSTASPPATPASTNYSGSTARPSPQSSVTRAVTLRDEPAAATTQSTIGTPYSETSARYPLPQHVAVRPRTAGATATVAGVSVPTHHTSGSKSDINTSKQEKRKTRLLKPMHILTRRKSGQDTDATMAERSAAAQAYARQKSIAIVGVNRLPEDFDPRIKGKVVHDFSAPRQARRNFSYNDAELDTREGSRASTSSVPQVPNFPANPASESLLVDPRRQMGNASSVRKSVHSPAFREHLAEDADVNNRLSSLNAERLENREFLQRVSHHSSNSGMSQESAILPPFARKSQILDSLQAGPYHEPESKRASDPPSGQERRSTYSSASDVVSPIGSADIKSQVVEVRSSFGQSLTPVSPAMSDKGVRPYSAVSDIQIHTAPTSPETRGHTTSEAIPRPTSTMLPQPAILTPASESISDDARPSVSVRSSYRDSAMAPEVVVLPERSSSLFFGDAPNHAMRNTQNDRLSTLAPGAIQIPDRTSSRPADKLNVPTPGSGQSAPSPGRTSDLPTPELTPIVGVADRVHVAPINGAREAPRLVEKRASAVGHAKRSSAATSAQVKHRVSNASRFSFQFDESRKEEEALEEKHRKIKGQSIDSHFSQSGMAAEEEEEEFDEDAMDDMDELEMQRQMEGPADADLVRHEEHEAKAKERKVESYSNELLHLQDARKQLQADDSDAESTYTDEEVDQLMDERDLPWYEHPVMRAHSAMANHYRNLSQSTMNSTLQGDMSQQQRVMSNNSPLYQQHSAQNMRNPTGSTPLRVNTHLASPTSAAFASDTYSASDNTLSTPGSAQPRLGVAMHPQAAAYPPSTSVGPELAKPALPHRNSGNSERNRAASGMSFASQHGVIEHARDSSRSSNNSSQARSSVQSQQARVASHTSPGGFRTSEARTNSSGLGLSGFSDFNFSEDTNAGATRPTSTEEEQRTNQNRFTKDSETMPAITNWADKVKHHSHETQASHKRGSSDFSSPISNGLANNQRAAFGGARPAQGSPQTKKLAPPSDDNDDMYFDDGGFDADMSGDVAANSGIDEEQFDDDAFLNRNNKTFGRPKRESRIVSAMTVASVGSDGPYPSFAMGSNPMRVLQRQSQLLLEDLPLQAPVDPKLIPQRNPSEDAKRLGLSDRVPPLPLPDGSAEAVLQRQANLQAYHAALADAANKAAAEGRFFREPSTSTGQTLSVYTKDQEDDRSQYSYDENGEENPTKPPTKPSAERMPSDESTGSKMDQSVTYSPPKMSFDFGFDDPPADESAFADDYEEDDDIVAAANAEALASEDGAFYGQEFGFYAKARPNSGEVEAINGGFFGEDGDDGLTRNKSLKEPNLTPITERSEFSTRNSFVNLGHGTMFGAPNASVGAVGSHSPVSALARMSVTPLMENDITSFDQLRKLRANAFGGSNSNQTADGELKSAKGTPTHASPWNWNMPPTLSQSPALSTKSPISPHTHAGMSDAGPVMPSPLGWGTMDATSSGPAPSNAPVASGHFDHPSSQQQSHSHPPEVSHSASSSLQLPFMRPASPAAHAAQEDSPDPDVTPKRLTISSQGSARPASSSSPAPASPVIGSARPAVNGSVFSHSRKVSDAVTYVRDESSPAGSGPPKWIMERRRTSEAGQLELVGREVVKGGWI